MNAKDRLIQEFDMETMTKNYANLLADAILDEYAHGLAEKQRKWAAERITPDCMDAWGDDLINFIDPEAAHKGRCSCTNPIDPKRGRELKLADGARRKAEKALRLTMERLDQLENHWHDQPHTEVAAQVRAALADIRRFIESGSIPQEHHD